MRVFHWILVVLILLLGLAHSYVALFCKHFTEETLWFFGSGMAIIFAGLINTVFLLTNSKAVRLITILVNLGVTTLFIFALSVVEGIQVFVGITLFALATVATLITRSKTEKLSA